MFRYNLFSIRFNNKFYTNTYRQQSVIRNENCKNDDYQLLHRSRLPTMHFQKSLLRLKIPELDKTCARYLRSQKVLLSDNDYQKTEKIVNTFQMEDGKRLQEILITYDMMNKHTSYISGPWFDMYLADRASVVLNYNPFLTFHPEERPGFNDPIIRASNALVSSLRFMNTLNKGVLEPEVYHMNSEKSDTNLFRNITKWSPSALASYAAYAFKAFPLDMSQFGNLFNSTRIPEIGKDRIQYFPNSKHMLFMKNGNFYVFDIYDDKGNILPPDHIHACVTYIYKDLTPPPKYPVSILTSENRDVWAELRRELIQAGNEESISLIDGAAFNIVFDKNKVGTDPRACFNNFLHGDGGNRWFDKSFSLIFSEDGMAALNFEHSWGDGVAVMRYFNEVCKDMKNDYIHPASKPANISPADHVKILDFKLTPAIQNAITKAQIAYKDRMSTLAVDIYESDILGKDLCKTHRVSPDAAMQLGIQLAYYLQNGCTVPTYESCSTSAFKHGRTETVRSATLETLAFSKAVCHSEDIRPDVAKLKNMIMECSKVHNQLTKEAAMGQGFDRHLFALKNIAQKDSKELPELFLDPAYVNINHNILSTSTLPSVHINFGGFAPVVKDGFGIGYQIKDNDLGLVVSSYPPARDGSGFVECANRAYTIIRDVLIKS